MHHISDVSSIQSQIFASSTDVSITAQSIHDADVGALRELTKVAKYLQEARQMALALRDSRSPVPPPADKSRESSEERVEMLLEIADSAMAQGERLLELLHPSMACTAVLSNPSPDAIRGVLEADEARLHTLQLAADTLMSSIANAETEINLKTTECNRYMRRLTELRAKELPVDPTVEAEMRTMYADYVTKHQNLEFIRFQLHKAKQAREPALTPLDPHPSDYSGDLMISVDEFIYPLAIFSVPCLTSPIVCRCNPTRDKTDH